MTGIVSLILATALIWSSPDTESCTAEAGARADEGTALAQVLAMDEAGRAFEEAATLDPDCARAQWGLVVIHLPWPGDAPSRLADARARDALVGITAPPTARDRAHIQALTALFEPAEEPFPRRRLAYRDALRRLVDEHPDDEAAVVWLALAELSLSTSPGDDAATQAIDLLRERFGAVPQEPGAAFAWLLASDDPLTDAGARDVVEVVANRAAAAPVARHVAARTYQRLGLWAEAARQDEAALDLVGALVDPRVRTGPGGRWLVPESLFNTYLELGQFARAQALLARTAAALANPRRVPPDLIGVVQQALARMRVRLRLDAQEWSVVKDLAPDGIADQNAGLYWFARGLGAARVAWPHQDAEAFAEARRAAEELEALAHAEGPSSETMRQWLLVRAAIAAGQYERDEMTVMLQEAQRIETELLENGVLDRPLVWADEVAGDLRLQVDEAGHARLRYAALLARQPGRARALLGLARAHAALGHRTDARTAYDQFLEVWADADEDRPELREAQPSGRRVCGLGVAHRGLAAEGA